MNNQTLKKLVFLSFFALPVLALKADLVPPPHKSRDTIDQVNSMETKDGFSAQFWMTTEEQIFSTWAKPGAIRSLKPTTAVKRNTPVYLALFIASPGIYKETLPGCPPRNVSDVTFDLYVINPKGIMSLASEKRTAWKEASPSPGLVYLARDRGTLNFEVIDPFGEYTILVVLHDNVRKTDLRLMRKLELVDEYE